MGMEERFRLETRKSEGRPYPLPDELDIILRLFLKAGKARGKFIVTARWPVKGNQELYEHPNFRPPRLTVIEAKIHPGGGNENARNVIINCPSAREAIRLYHSWLKLFEQYTVSLLKRRSSEYGLVPGREASSVDIESATYEQLTDIILLVADPDTVGVADIDEDAFRYFVRTLFSYKECPALYDERKFTQALNAVIDGGHGIKVTRRRTLHLGSDASVKTLSEGWSNTDHPGDRMAYLVEELTTLLKIARQFRRPMEQIQHDLMQIERRRKQIPDSLNDQNDPEQGVDDSIERVFADLRRRLIIAASQL